MPTSKTPANQVQTSNEDSLLREARALAEYCGAFVERLRAHRDLARPTAQTAFEPALDQRWISIGATDLQRGFMAIERGISKPPRF